MTDTQLRTFYETVNRMIQAEKTMRSIVFPVGNSKRVKKLAECDQAAEALSRMAVELQKHVSPTGIQEVLVDADEPRRGGY